MTLIKKKQQHCIDPQDAASYEAIHKSRRGSCSSGGRVIEGCWIDPVILLPPARQSVLDKDGGGGEQQKGLRLHVHECECKMANSPFKR